MRLKEVYRVRVGVEGLVEIDPDRAGFLTLTFADDVQDAQEASRRFNSFATHWLRRHAEGYIGSRERQKNGRWHYHLVVIWKVKIREGFDFAAVRRGDYRSACPALRQLWAELREVCPRYGFGRHQLEPVAKPEAAGAYVAKYLAKSERRPEDRGVRLLMAGGVGRRLMASSRFSWVRGKAREFRACVAEVARVMLGSRWKPGRVPWYDNADMLRRVWGKRWAWKVIQVMNRNPDWVQGCLMAYDGA
jgi:hypothetical protein